MSYLTMTALFAASMMAGTPPAPAGDDTPLAVRQCQDEVEAACGGSGEDCLETGYRACYLLHGDPAEARSLSGANLRAQIFAIDAPPAGSTLERAEEEASSIFIINTEAD